MSDDNVKKIRVLIADDKPEMRQVFTNLLYFEEDLIVVGTASDGAEAVSKAQELQPDVILMDIEMPNMDGVTATEQIKKSHPNTAIIGMSSDARLKVRVMVAGAIDFLAKPFTGDEITAAIRKAAGQPE